MTLLWLHRQAYHKRLQWCIGKLDRDIQPVHMFLFEHLLHTPTETDPWTERTWPVICPQSLLDPYLHLWKMKRLIIYQSNKRARYAVVLSLIPQWRERGGTWFYTLPFKVWGQQNCLISLKEVSYAHQGRIYLIKNTVKNIILWNIITI